MFTMTEDRTKYAVANAAITDALGNQWVMTTSGQVEFNGEAISWTRDAIEIGWIAGVIWYRTNAGDWFSLYLENGFPASGLGPAPLAPDEAEHPPIPQPVVPLRSPSLPLTTATTGHWVDGDAIVGETLPSGARAMHYIVLPPQDHDPKFAYPLVVYLHDNQAGTGWYSGPLDLTSLVEFWANAPWFRAAYPAVVVCPYADQGLDAAGTLFNWTDPANRSGVLAVIDQVSRDYAVDERRIYITGDGMGGDGAWALALSDPRFAAALPMSGGLPGDPEVAQIESLTLGEVSVLAIAGGTDPTSAQWSRRIWETIAGNTSFPAPPGSASGTFTYLEDPALGRAVWDVYRAVDAADATGVDVASWLFSQVSTRVALRDPRRIASTVLTKEPGQPGVSPDRTTVPPASVISDTQHHKWSLSAGFRVEMDGTEDQTSNGVVELAWIGGVLWSLDYHGMWRRKTTASAPWDPPRGRRQSPLAGRPKPLVNGGLPLAVAGSWARQVLTAGALTQQYAVLLPQGYDPARSWRVIVVLHDHLTGNALYADGVDEVTPVFAALNTPTFRSAYPAILVAPFCDQRADLTGQAFNFGGLTTARQHAEVNAIRFISSLKDRVSVSEGRIFVLGIGAMGGAAAWAWLLRYPDLFAGAMVFDGTPVEFGSPTQSTINALREKPLWVSHGLRDATVSPKAWSEPLYTAYGGTIPGRGARSPSGAMYLQEPISGHGTWTAGLGLPAGKARWDSLFSR